MGVAASYDNAERYGAGLRQLDAYAQQQIGLVPTARRRVLTSHDAFSYFGAAYGVTSLSPVDLSTEGEALARGSCGHGPPVQGGEGADPLLPG